MAESFHTASGERVRVFLSALILFAFSATEARLSMAENVSAESQSDSLFSNAPTIEPNPITRAPLVALVRFESTKPVIPSLIFDDGERTWTKKDVGPLGTDHVIAALGMRPNRTHKIRVAIRDPKTGKEQTSEPMTFDTPKLPKSFPPLEVLISEPEKMEPGVTLFCPNIWINDRSENQFGYLMALDSSGEVVWYLRSGHRTADVRILSNGHLLYIHASYRAFLEVDLLGNIVRQWHGSRLTDPPNENSIPVDMDTVHHEIIEMPNGNFLTISTILEHFEEFPSNERDPDAPWLPAYAVVDELVEIVPDTGEIVWRLPVKEFLDPKRYGYMALTGFWKDKYEEKVGEPVYDWSHANAMIYLPEEDAVIVSFRHLDCMIKVFRKTKQIDWIFGDHRGWSEEFQKYLLTPDGSMRWPYHHHAPQLTPHGTVLLYDNGNFRTVPHNEPVSAIHNESRVVEYKIDEDNRTVEQLWEYEGEPGDEFFCPFYCEADWLPQTGNILVTDGGHIELEDGTPHGVVPGERQWARIFELTRDGDKSEKVFEIKCDSGMGSSLGWSIYRSIRLDDLYDLKVEPQMIDDGIENEAIDEPDFQAPPDATR
ncbi:aryl-sulfate sulfotransferase [Thalassoglobus sp. JC818]|uniref:aryl-sulfate sulfotransferase n=1 Tax=Thalassoglobus sp. JC818 TaxID=3232136 RepID=UPI0034585E15